MTPAVRQPLPVDIHDRIAKDSGISRCMVRCDKCERVLIVNGGDCLHGGWPECHGHTMTLLRAAGCTIDGEGKV